MNTHMADKVRKALEELGLPGQRITVEPSDPVRVVASVVSEGFSKMSEEDRQELVWKQLMDKMTDDELRWVEFVFTSSPTDEDEAASAQSA